MRKAYRSLVCVTLLLAACQSKGLPTARAGKTRTVAAASQSAAPKQPAATTTSAYLQAPAASTSPLSGIVTVDAAYLQAQGNAVPVGGVVAVGNGLVGKVKGADVLSDAGLGLISEHGGALIANNGGGLVSDAGLGIVANDSDNVASDGVNLLAAGVIANNAGNLIANNAGNLLSDHGSGIVANNAAGLIGKTKYRLAQVTADGLTPAAGMVVSLYSLDRHGYVPVGRDAAGQDVYSVYSDDQGAYKLYMPPGDTGAVMVVATVPGSGDYRQTYNAIPGHDVTEDTALVTKLARLAFAQRLHIAMFRDASLGDPTDPTQAILFGFATKLVAHVVSSHIRQQPVANQERLAQRMADAILPTAEQLEGYASVTSLQNYQTSASAETAMDALRASVKKMREHGATYYQSPELAALVDEARARAEAHVVKDALPFSPFPDDLTAANVKKPSDIVDFLVRGMLADGYAEQDLVLKLYGQMGLSQDDFNELIAGSNGLFIALGLKLAGDDALQDRLVALVDAAGKAD